MSRFNLSLLVLLASVASLPVRAGEKPRVVVVPFAIGEGAAEASAGRFTGLILDELKRRGEVLQVVGAPALKGATAERPAGGKRGPSAETVAALDAGRKAFEELRFEDAAASLKLGLEGALADPATADFEQVIDGYVKLAAASFRMGEEKDAKLALGELCRLAPAYELPSGFPPVFQRELEKAKKRVDKLPRGQVSIDGPAGATAFLDGRDLGMVPIVEEPVPAGLHYVKVEGSKSERFGQAVDVKGTAKVRASFGVVKPSDAPVENPRITATLDEATQRRLVSYAKAANADYALVGYVYRTAETQLTAGAALFSMKKSAFTALQTVSFDTDVMTANTEAFRLADDLVRRLSAFAAGSLPINLATRAKQAALAKPEPRPAPAEVEPAAPPSKAKKPVALVPQDPAPVERTSRAFDRPSVVEVDAQDPSRPPEVKPAAVPVWVWVVTGVAVAAGVGVGGYFGYTAITKPVSGTVTATW